MNVSHITGCTSCQADQPIAELAELLALHIWPGLRFHISRGLTIGNVVKLLLPKDQIVKCAEEPVVAMACALHPQTLTD